MHEENTVIFAITIVPKVIYRDSIKTEEPKEFVFVFYRDDDEYLDHAEVFGVFQQKLSENLGHVAPANNGGPTEMINNILRCSALVKDEMECEGFVYVRGGLAL